MADYDSDEKEMLARAEELRALEGDADEVGEDHGDGDCSQSQGASSSYRSGRSRRRNSSGYGHDDDEDATRSYRSHRSGTHSYRNEDDDDSSHYSESDGGNDDERSYRSERSQRSQTSKYSHGTATTSASAKKSRGKKKSKRKSNKSKSSKSDEPDKLSTILSKEEEDQLLAYNAPPVPYQFSGQYLRGAFGVGDLNVLGDRARGGAIRMSGKQRDALIQEGGLDLNIGPLIVQYDDEGEDEDNGGEISGNGGNSTKCGVKVPARPGSLIYGCRGPAPLSASPLPDPLGLNINSITDKPVVTAADFLRWLTSLVRHHSIRRILCLLNATELQAIAPPAGYQRMVESQGIHVTMCDVCRPGARDVALKAMEEAVRAGERIAVHCSGGEHRTGNVMALWLCRYGDDDVDVEVEVEVEGNGDDTVDADGAAMWTMRPEEAVKRVVAEAARAGLSRHLVVEQVRALIEDYCCVLRRSS